VKTSALAREVFFGPDTPDQQVTDLQPRMRGAPLRASSEMRIRVPRRPLAGTPTAVGAGAHGPGSWPAPTRKFQHSRLRLPLRAIKRQRAAQRWVAPPTLADTWRKKASRFPRSVPVSGRVEHSEGLRWR
jgi:hypothetical protein